ncbi:MAG: hypothetical protein II381_11015, partial [Victivallales bacterium]|nr:hypothetical protein [Victivallales bacterium]
MRCLKNILLFLLLGVIALHAQDKPAVPQPAKPAEQPAKPAAKPAQSAKPAADGWHEKSAAARIRFTVFSRRSPVIFVPVPTELSDAKNVAAVDDR